jgi:hypothetical protein
LELRRRVHIWDEDPPYPLFREPGDSVPGDWRGRVPEGFPPVASYVLSFEKYTEKEWSLLADGIHPVYARRYVNRGDIIGGGASGCWPEPRDEYRHEWLTASLEGTDVPALPLYETVDIKWTGGRQPWSRRTRMAVENLYDDFRAWRDALHARGLLTDRARRTVRPKIELKVVDRRRYQRDPLPPFPEIPFDPKVPERHPPSVRGDV